MLIKAFFIFIFSFSAKAYRLTQDFTNGFYWATLPVNFQIFEQDPNRKALLEELVNSAINQWEGETGFNLWNLTTGGTSNIIRWSTRFAAETKMDPESVLAVAIRYTNGPYFARSEIVINGSHNAFNSPYPAINKMNIGTTLVHELGHTIGLDHSENMMAIMAPTLQYPYNGIHSDDVSGMNDAVGQTEHRQLIRYISPLSYSQITESSQPISCGTIGPIQSQIPGQEIPTLLIGILTSFIRRILRWFKSLF